MARVRKRVTDEEWARRDEKGEPDEVLVRVSFGDNAYELNVCRTRKR